MFGMVFNRNEAREQQAHTTTARYHAIDNAKKTTPKKTTIKITPKKTTPKTTTFNFNTNVNKRIRRRMI
jgi:hypothetical protein